MNPKYEKTFQYLAVLILAVVFYLVIIFIYRKLGLPDSDTIIAWAQNYYEQYGYWVVLIGALAATSAGILRMDFYKFALYAFISITLWNSFWTIIFYWFGAGLLKHLNLLIIVGGIFVYLMFTKSLKGGPGERTEGHINLS